MNAQMIATIKLMDKNKVAYSLQLEDLYDYDFIWDSKNLCTLHLTTSNLSIPDLNMLISRPYESYILIGLKRVHQGETEKTYDIPARVFKHAVFKGNSKTTYMTFYETTEARDADLKV